MTNADVSVADITRALNWARHWTNLSSDVSDDTLRMAFGKLNAPRTVKDTNVDDAVCAARKLLLSTSARNRATRVKAAFPYFELRIRGEDCGCAPAAAIGGKLVKEAMPALPLDGCTEKRCYCWLRSVTKQEALRRGA